MQARRANTSIYRVLKPAKTLIVWTVAVFVVVMAINLALPLFTQVFVDSIITARHPEWQRPMCIMLAIMAAATLCLVLIVIVHKRRLQLKYLIETATIYFWHSLRLPMSEVSKYGAGDLLARYSAGYSSATSVMLKLVPAVVMALQVAIMLVMILLYSPALSAISLVSIFLSLYLSVRMSSRQKSRNKKQQEFESELQSTLLDGISNVETIKAFGAEDAYFRQAMDPFAKSLSESARVNKTTILLNMIPSVLQSATTIVCLCIGAVLIIRGNMTVGALMAFQGFLGQFLTPITNFTKTIRVMNKASAACDRFVEVEDLPTDVPSGIQTADIDTLDKLKGRIELRNVTFGYDRNRPPLIENFSLTIEPGQSIAFAGGSGSGKSTIANLIAGLYEPWSGEILFDGKKKSEINRHAFYSSVAVINQDITLFEGTIADNIKMWDGQTEDFAMIMAAKDAHIHDDIAMRPDGYASMLNNSGSNLSGGQRQRIEIATALAKEPTVLIMDEATSALDPITEQLVSSSIRDLKITGIVVAHRLSTIRDCDQIIVLDHGKIVDRGTHESLMEDTDGLYYRMMQYR